MNTIQSRSTTLKRISLLSLFALTPLLAQAHILPGAHSHGFASGFNHPIHGLDHILAMMAVGLWAAQLGGRAIWTVPATFVSVMIVGGILGMSGVHLPMVEAGIMASILILGILIAAAARLPMAVSMTIVGLFALFHGHAHGAEIPAATSGLTYALGFIVATIMLHACGIGLGLLTQKRVGFTAVRYAGAAIAITGLCMWFS